MRFYLAVGIGALTLSIILITLVYFYEPALMSGAEFRQSAFLEVLGFIVTTAFIGSLTAAITEWRLRQRIEPFIDAQILEIINSARLVLDKYILSINEAKKASPDIGKSIVVGDDECFPHRSFNPSSLLFAIHQLKLQFEKLRSSEGHYDQLDIEARLAVRRLSSPLEEVARAAEWLESKLFPSLIKVEYSSIWNEVEETPILFRRYGSKLIRERVVPPEDDFWNIPQIWTNPLFWQNLAEQFQNIERFLSPRGQQKLSDMDLEFIYLSSSAADFKDILARCCDHFDRHLYWVSYAVLLLDSRIHINSHERETFRQNVNHEIASQDDILDGISLHFALIEHDDLTVEEARVRRNIFYRVLPDVPDWEVLAAESPDVVSILPAGSLGLKNGLYSLDKFEFESGSKDEELLKRHATESGKAFFQ